MIICDSNVLLSYLNEQEEETSRRYSLAILSQHKGIQVPVSVVYEVITVSFAHAGYACHSEGRAFDVKRKRDVLLSILKVLGELEKQGAIVLQDREYVQTIIHHIYETGLDCVDCELLHRAETSDCIIATRDRKLKNALLKVRKDAYYEVPTASSGMNLFD